MPLSSGEEAEILPLMEYLHLMNHFQRQHAEYNDVKDDNMIHLYI